MRAHCVRAKSADSVSACGKNHARSLSPPFPTRQGVPAGRRGRRPLRSLLARLWMWAGQHRGRHLRCFSALSVGATWTARSFDFPPDARQRKEEQCNASTSPSFQKVCPCGDAPSTITKVWRPRQKTSKFRRQCLQQLPLSKAQLWNLKAFSFGLCKISAIPAQVIKRSFFLYYPIRDYPRHSRGGSLRKKERPHFRADALSFISRTR